MKNGFVILFFILMYCSAEAMEKVLTTQYAPSRQEIESSFLRLQNGTNDILLVRSQAVGEERSCQRTLVPGQFMDFNRIDVLALLQVKAYGVYKEWISVETIFLGLANLAELARDSVRRLDTHTIRIMVSPGWNSLETRNLAAYTVAFFCEKVLSYRITVAACEPLESYQKVTDAFPQVEKAIKERGRILPHHFLSIGEYAQGYDIRKAYESLKQEWRVKSSGKDPETKRFADDVLALIEGSYKVLIDETGNGQHFRNLVQQHLFDSRQTYNVMPDIRELLNRLLAQKGRTVMAAKRREEAIAALHALRTTCSQFHRLMLLEKSNEIIIEWLARKFFGSTTVEHLAQAAFALRTKEAQGWLIAQIQKHNEWQMNAYVIFFVFEHFNEEYYQPIARALAQFNHSLNVQNRSRNTPLIEALLRSDFKTGTFLIENNANRYISNDTGIALDIACKVRKQFVGIPTQEAQEKLRECDLLIAQLRERPLPFNLSHSYMGGNEIV